MKKLSLVLCVLLFTVLVSGQGINPISKVRDYNGTYLGSYGTGSAGYTTLYRDNQDSGAISGCRGEGCGRHPGVDIATPSGTDVVSAFSGSVVISRCDSSWGGLVVIRSSHPQRAWETIYHSYAHLKSRIYANGLSVRVGDQVSSGDVIGRSGGGSADPCKGSSSGPHLHFQIDKDDGNLEPYFPSLTSLNTRDDSFFVAGKTYNPMVMVRGGYRWRFGQSGNRELWDLFNFQDWGVSDHALWVDSGYDPYIRRGGLTNCGMNKKCSSSINAEASDYKSVYLDLYNQCSSYHGKIYFTTKNENFWDESKVIDYFPGGSASFRGRVGVSYHPKWTGVITGLRIDPAISCNQYSFDPTYYGEIALVR